MIQRVIENAGIATIGISIVRRYSERVRPPRTLFVDLPFGHPLGASGDLAGQRTIIEVALRELYRIKRPGTIVDFPVATDRP